MKSWLANCSSKYRNEPPTPNRTRPATNLFAALMLSSVLAIPLAAQTASAPNATLPGHVVTSLANAALIPHNSQMDEEPITLTVVLNLSDPGGAKSLELEREDPNSANFHKTISQPEFTSRFGPTQDAWDAVLSYLEENGFKLSLDSPNRRTMTVTGTRAQAQRAFHATIDDYELGARQFHAIATDPAVPSSIAPLISSVFGLSNKARMQPANSPFPFTPQSLATAYDGSLTPSGKTNTSGLPPGLDGSGQNIALLEFDYFDSTDVEHWLKFAGLPSKLIDHLSAVPINGGTTPSGCTQTQAHCGTTEVLLDIEAAMGIAQGANIVVYDAPPGTDLATALNETGNYLTYGPNGVLSTSWSECEGDVSRSDAISIDSIISDFQAWGITVFADTDDNGGNCTDGDGNTYPGGIDFPADAPHAVAVGGTSLNVNSSNGYINESWWNNSGGFGVSQFIGKPFYQLKDYPGATGRSVPDVSMNAGDGIIVCQAQSGLSPDCGTTSKPGVFNVIGGTSLATPLMAATWAIANQAHENATGLILSAGNGLLYQWPHGFHAASSMTGTGNNFQHVGLGSPDITQLIAKVVPPRIDSYSPENGPATAGTKVTIYGAGFIGVEQVTFGGIAGTHLTIDSDKKLTVEAPEAPAEEATIKVQTPGGWATAAGPYTYNPEIEKVSPSSGSMEGGATVTITGRALSTSEIFIFGESRATKVSCPSSSECTMLTAAHAPGSVVVQAQTVWGYGYSPITSATSYKYDSPAITGFTPSVGPTTGGLQIQLYGVSLGSKTTVSFGGVNATGIDCPDPTYCYMKSPAHAVGTVQVTATTNGITTAPAKSEFTFKVFPSITGISPSSADIGAVVTLTGTGFSITPGKTTFNFFGISVVGSCTSTMQCTAVVPAEVGTAQSTVVPVTVNGLTSLDWVVFSYKNRIPPPPCKGTTCG